MWIEYQATCEKLLTGQSSYAIDQLLFLIAFVKTEYFNFAEQMLQSYWSNLMYNFDAKIVVEVVWKDWFSLYSMEVNIKQQTKYNEQANQATLLSNYSS